MGGGRVACDRLTVWAVLRLGSPHKETTMPLEIKFVVKLFGFESASHWHLRERGATSML